MKKSIGGDLRVPLLFGSVALAFMCTTPADAATRLFPRRRFLHLAAGTALAGLPRLLSATNVQAEEGLCARSRAIC